MVTGSVFGNFYVDENTASISEKMSSCPFYQHFISACKTVSVPGNSRGWMAVIMLLDLEHENKNLLPETSVNVPLENSLPPC